MFLLLLLLLLPLEGEAEEEDGGFVVVGRANAADAAAPPPSSSVSAAVSVSVPSASAAAAAPPSSSVSAVSVSVPSASAAAAPPPSSSVSAAVSVSVPSASAAASPASAPITDWSGEGEEFFVGVPVDDEETRRALASEVAEATAAAAEEEGAANDDDGGNNLASSSSSVSALRGSGSVDDPLELWLPCSRLSSSSAFSPVALEWRRPSGGGVSGKARKATNSAPPRPERGAGAAFPPFFYPFSRERERLYRGGRPADPSEGPPLVKVKIAYHAFSEEEIELAGGGKGKGGGGGGGKKKEEEGGVASSSSSPPIPIPIPTPSVLTPSSRAADILGGGILFVKPRQARNLSPPPRLWRRALIKKKAAWVVRVAVAGGVSAEGGPVSKGGTSPTFVEVRSGEAEEERIFEKKSFARDEKKT